MFKHGPHSYYNQYNLISLFYFFILLKNLYEQDSRFQGYYLDMDEF